MENLDLLEILSYIDPIALDYQEWVNVGMALKQEGYTAADWDNWSKRDSKRYKQGECFSKWTTFNGTSTPVTAGTIVQMAKNFGWKTQNIGYEIGWNDTIGGKKDDLVVIDKDWVEGKAVKEPSNWNPVLELTTYLDTLFDSTEIVGYVTDSWERDGKYMPTQGDYTRTAGELIQALNKCNGDIGAVLGDYKEEVGAWIRFNPLDGKGIRNENVTEFRYALVESDSMDIDKQNAIIRELELPVACLVHSGKKSLHAIVKVDASTYPEYQKRVEFLYSVCKKNGLELDRQNRNPSRLSRMPGIIRNGKKQFLVDTNIGKANWEEWKEWIESVNDDLPDPENMENIWGNLPPLSPPLIDNVLRQGHKMLIAGPSKAGKSYALIELCCAFAEGREWLGFNCAKGKVLYVNLELDRASCLHRFKDVYTELGWQADNLKNIDIWNLRGKSVPMDKLAPKLIRRASKKDYIAIIIDPIYKVITGDENSADQMAHFCNQFDKVCTELGCAVIYCHHHSKGAQGGKKSMDRASGSGVFARDPDALLDLVELQLNENIIKLQENKVVCKICKEWLSRFNCLDKISQDDELSSSIMLDTCRKYLQDISYKNLMLDIDTAKKKLVSKTAWRIEGTLREFPKFSPLNLWFDYPVHKMDTSGILKDIDVDDNTPNWKKAINNRKPKENKKQERVQAIETAFNVCDMGDGVSVNDLAEYLGTSEKTVRNRIKEHGGFTINDSKITRQV